MKKHFDIFRKNVMLAVFYVLAYKVIYKTQRGDFVLFLKKVFAKAPTEHVETPLPRCSTRLCLVD